MKKMKKLVAGLLSASMLFTMNPVTVNATETDAIIEYSTSSDANEADDDGMLLNYLVVGSTYIQTGDTQYVIADMGETGVEITNATLTYRNEETKESFQVAYDQIINTLVVFLMDFSEEGQDGQYTVTDILVEADGKQYHISIADTGIDAEFYVNQIVDAESDLAYGDGLIINEIEQGEVTSQDIAAAVESVDTGELLTYNDFGDVVICLDPGHGGYDSGAVGNNIVEKTVNLAIAQYCKAELESYYNIEVYMTREGDTSCNGATSWTDTATATGDCSNRVAYAASVGADLLVSIHNNSSTSSAAYGTEVYYPNSNYNSTAGAVGEAVAAKVLANLVALGLSNRGIHIRNSEDNTLYPDGSLADYYGIIKGAKKNGIPGIIIEHAFLSNASDAALLANDAMLQKMGVADATAIAEYYGLSKDPASARLTYYKGMEYSPIFDYDYYIKEYTDLPVEISSSRRETFKHFLFYGMQEGRRGNDSFNVYTYANNHPELQEVFGHNAREYYLHYLETGYPAGETAVGDDKDYNFEENILYKAMYRMYNPNSGEHFYTASIEEKDNLVFVGWNYEGIAWNAPMTGDPVYRLYNPNAGDHHYTLSEKEKDDLIEAGWNYEGISWYSGGDVPMYRVYNPNAIAGAHHYSANEDEINGLVEIGWRYEGKAWYAVK